MSIKEFISIKKLVSKNMVEQKKQYHQIMRYSDPELEFLNNTFAERIDLLILIRKFLLQGELTDQEKNLFVAFSPELIRILKKAYLPDIDLTTPIGQLVDLWSNIDTKNKDIEGAWLEMAARKILIDYIQERFEALVENRFDSKIQISSLEYDPRNSKEKNFINLSARNSLISHIDFQTGQLWILAGQKKESLKEIQERLLKNSSK